VFNIVRQCGTRSIFSRKESFFSKKFRVFTFFSFLEIFVKMDTQMDTGEREEKGEEGEQEREIEPSKTLISNVSLIKKSVESKGEPRFIASVFRQVCLIYVFNKNSLLVVSFARDLTFIEIASSKITISLLRLLSFFLFIYTHHHHHLFFPHITADAHGENEIDRRRYLRVYRGRLTQRFGIRDDVETVFESKENRDEESKRGGRRRLWRKIKIRTPRDGNLLLRPRAHAHDRRERCECHSIVRDLFATTLFVQSTNVGRVCGEGVFLLLAGARTFR
jgi:hypothetical protein